MLCARGSLYIAGVMNKTRLVGDGCSLLPDVSNS
jgi:hypothetical protein